MHLLKHQFQPRRRSRSWLATILEHRQGLRDDLQTSPSLRGYAEGVFEDAYADARASAAEQAAGDYLVGYAVEQAEGVYELRDGRLAWQAPQAENLHLEIAVRDRADGRFIPGLEVHATLIHAGGHEVGTHRQPFLWHPWLYHYVRNWEVPGDERTTSGSASSRPTSRATTRSTAGATPSRSRSSSITCRSRPGAS